jgi:glycosyltransferase involved in cell wall biosynthesis
MNILFVTEDHSIKNYGVTTVVSQLANEIAYRNNGMQIIIAATGNDSVQQCEAVKVELIRSAMADAFWRWSPNLTDRLNDIVTRYKIDLIHIHGIWMAAQWAALMIARNRKIPCIVSSHAMLEPWYWNKQSLLKKYKKKIYFKSVFQSAITENTLFHAITPIEKDNLHKLLPKQKIVVIPNAIGLDKESAYRNDVKTIVPEKTFLFLGRLHPVKGVDLLIKAFYLANLDSDWRLVIAGPETVPQYAQKIKADLLNLGLSDRVLFTGPIFGADKEELIRKAWTMVTPSYCEVVGMVNLEASACSVPSITTFETGLWDWEEGGGILIHPDVDELACSLLKASRWSLAERLDYGNKSYNLVANKYSLKAVIPKWEALYSSLMTDHTLQIN